MASGEMERQLSKRDGAREYGLTRCSGGGAAIVRQGGTAKASFALRCYVSRDWLLPMD